MTRRTLVVLLIAAVIVSSAATLFANAWIRSPEEAAAETAPPEATPILAPVVEQVLTAEVVTRGTAHYRAPREVSVTPSTLKRGFQVVTSLPRVGSVVRDGDVLMTISGRPVFVFAGAQPTYRDLGPGMSGPDVRQLEAALLRAGFDPGAVDDRFDAGTEAAVTALYRRSGAAPIIADEADLAAVRTPDADLVPGARAGPGVQLPADEVVFVASTPARVGDILTPVGAPVTGSLLTLTRSDVVVDALLPVEQATLIKDGATVVLDEPALGIEETSGSVTHVESRPGTRGADEFHVFFQVAVDGRPPAGMVGTSVRVTIPTRSTEDATLTVPLSAVSLGPDGASRVQRSVVGGFEFVPVRTGLSAGGYVSVTPLNGELMPGDMVVVGSEGDGGGDR
jgi:hypothetical protein